jgi:hypothetical protein
MKHCRKLCRRIRCLDLQTCRVARQNVLLAKECIDLMMDKLSEATDSGFKALREIEKEKLQTFKAYNKSEKNLLKWVIWFEN